MSYIVKEIVNPENEALKVYKLNQIIEIKDINDNPVSISQPVTINGQILPLTPTQLEVEIANIDKQKAELDTNRANIFAMLSAINDFRAKQTPIAPVVAETSVKTIESPTEAPLN